MQKYQEEVDKWFTDHNWSYWHPLSQFTRLVEEVGEVARILNDLYGEKPKKSDEVRQNLAEEIGDVVYTLICLANSQHFRLRYFRNLKAKPQNPPLHIFAILSRNCGSLGEAIASDQSVVEIGRRTNAMMGILCRLAKAVDTDIDHALRLSLEKVTSRDRNRY